MLDSLLSLRYYSHDGRMSGGIMCPPPIGGVLECGVLRGGGLIFGVAVCQEGAVVEE